MINLKIKILSLVTQMGISLNKKRNIIAKTLKNPLYKQRIVKPKKGKGSYKRKKNYISLAPNC